MKSYEKAGGSRAGRIGTASARARFSHHRPGPIWPNPTHLAKLGQMGRQRNILCKQLLRIGPAPFGQIPESGPSRGIPYRATNATRLAERTSGLHYSAARTAFGRSGPVGGFCRLVSQKFSKITSQRRCHCARSICDHFSSRSFAVFSADPLRKRPPTSPLGQQIIGLYLFPSQFGPTLACFNEIGDDLLYRIEGQNIAFGDWRRRVSRHELNVLAFFVIPRC